MNEIDDSDLAQCCACGYVDDWVEIPGGHCAVSGESMYYCPRCDEVDNMADYDPERAKRIDEKKRSQIPS